jgi:hypothetical protein
MSEANVSPAPKGDAKSSLNKSSEYLHYSDKASQSKGKKKPIEHTDDAHDMTKSNVSATPEEKKDQRLLSKSSKREALEQKGESQFMELVK